MKFRKIGKTGINVSEISFGTMAFGGAQYKFTDNPVSEEDSIKCLNKAIDLGINYIDSANIYGAFGNAEKIIGNVIKDYERSDLVLSSKTHFVMSKSVNDRGLSRKHILESVDKSLQRLGTDYLDLYYAHRYDYSTPLEETIEAMNYLIDEGKILYWATSNWYASSLERAYGIAERKGLKGPVVDQGKYNMFLRYDAEVELPYTAEYTGLGLVAYKILGEGLLSGKYLRDKYSDLTEEEITHLSRNLANYGDQFTETEYKKLEEVNEIAKELEITMSQLSYAWVLKNPLVNTALMSTRNLDRIVENIGAIDVHLNEDIMKKISEIMQNEPLANRFYDSYPYYLMLKKLHPKALEGKYPYDPEQF